MWLFYLQGLLFLLHGGHLRQNFSLFQRIVLGVQYVVALDHVLLLNNYASSLHEDSHKTILSTRIQHKKIKMRLQSLVALAIGAVAYGKF